MTKIVVNIIAIKEIVSKILGITWLDRSGWTSWRPIVGNHRKIRMLLDLIQSKLEDDQNLVHRPIKLRFRFKEDQKKLYRTVAHFG